MKNIAKYAIFPIAFCSALIFMLSSCKKEEMVYEETRLFRPVLNKDLTAKLNTIIIDMARIKQATSYNIELSQDSFKTAPLYKFVSDTNYIIVDKDIIGEELEYNSLYQVRVSANASDAEYNSRPALLGSVRTEPLPSIMMAPRAFDVTDILARVRWTPTGNPVDQVKIFAGTDRKLKTALASYAVTSGQNGAGEVIIDKLTPATFYQVAIYSAGKLRGYYEYTTLVKGVYPGDPNVIDLTTTEDPKAIEGALASATEGSIFLLKKGVRYNFPSSTFLLDVSITVKGAYGLTEKRAELFSSGDWRVKAGVTIDHVTFDDIDIVGSDPAGVYVFNINNANTTITNLTFNNCNITSLRGISRLRSTSFITNFTINNCIVSNIGNYGIFTCDQNADNQAAIDNIKLQNSTFYQMTVAFSSYNNAKSFLIDACTFSEFSEPGQRTFRYRGPDGRNNVLNGLTITNSIWGTAWDKAQSGNKSVIFREGLTGTTISVSNTWATSDFAANAGTEMAGFPSLSYSGAATKLWVDPAKGNFSIADASFAGKTSSGDPRWRVKP